MDATGFLLRLFLPIINLPMVGDELDEDTRERMAQYALFMEQEMARLLQELDKAQEGSGLAWITLLFDNLQDWQFWVIAGALVLFSGFCWMIRLLQEAQERILGEKTQKQSGFPWSTRLYDTLQWLCFCVVAVYFALLFGLCLWFRKRTHEIESSSTEERSSCNMLNVKEEQEHEEVLDETRDLVFNKALVEEQEEKEHEEVLDEARDLVFNKRLVEEQEEKEYEEVLDEVRELVFNERLVEEQEEKDIEEDEWDFSYRAGVVEELVDALHEVFHWHFSNSIVPMLEPPIGVGSTFEGWSLCHDDAVYQVLLPLKAPRGYVFHLEMGTAREIPAEDPCIRVELECTCTGQQREENLLCFLHHSQKEMTTNQDPSFLHSFCTGAYLDVQKTASWFQTFVTSAWTQLLFESYYSMKILPCSRSCKLQISSNRRETLFIEFIFGVQHGNSDIFLSSQAPEDTITPNTRWPVSFAVAEFKFFRHMARQAPDNHALLKCLRTLVHKLAGRSFSTHTFKTIVMHLLSSAGQSHWNMGDFKLWMRDIIRYLRRCLDKKRLDHFFIGNKNMPEDINLPLEYQTAEPLNLFQHLLHDSDAHARAIYELTEVFSFPSRHQ